MQTVNTEDDYKEFQRCACSKVITQHPDGTLATWTPSPWYTNPCPVHWPDDEERKRIVAEEGNEAT
jgi:hypothetical protein